MIGINRIKKIVSHRSVAFVLSSFLFAGTVALCGVTATKAFNRIDQERAEPVISGERTGYTFVLDAGHGGEDGGAVGVDGTEEKELNLAIATALEALLRLNGESTVMTRTEDILLYDYFNDLENYQGQKKMYDLRNRLKITEREDNAVYVGIHMNKFSDSRYSGLQVYYSKNTPQSASLAGMIQMNVKNAVQKENNRQSRPPAPASIF